MTGASRDTSRLSSAERDESDVTQPAGSPPYYRRVVAAELELFVQTLRRYENHDAPKRSSVGRTKKSTPTS
ncbi:hypothetical protein RRG08_049226 [Elysia crispata]|uniref:Uncharacterized protein n=1 Tax=Elysia crispata TaxID=231223 RepID=A0AAE1D4C9_9GAST|nr:hypothetical protein RRG08_049226 [Elysia crispata]